MADEANTAKGAVKKIRVLIAHEEHLPNHVLSLPEAEAKVAVKAGWADDDDAGVAYAEKNEPQPDTKSEG